jgi:hypothetical protein
LQIERDPRSVNLQFAMVNLQFSIGLFSRADSVPPTVWAIALGPVFRLRLPSLNFEAQPLKGAYP